MDAVADLTVEEELKPLTEIAEQLGWGFRQIASLRFVLTMPAKDGSFFGLIAECEKYPAFPPAWRWCNPDTLATERPEDTPKGSGYFHDKGVICAPWNRLAYKSEDHRGPHGDWTIGNWRQNPKTGGCITLAAMALKVAQELRGPKYSGRRG